MSDGQECPSYGFRSHSISLRCRYTMLCRMKLQQFVPKPTTMEILLNGEPRAVNDSWTIADLLADLKIDNRFCAVERNFRVVPREQHPTSPLQPGDRVEIVTLVGGG